MNNKSVNKFDLRLRERLLKDGQVSKEEITQYDASLEDQSENMLDIQEIIDREEEESSDSEEVIEASEEVEE
ncbi:MAG: hypothetical protein VX984_00760 [Thermodesulfobacteriota bacterium]|nr:hypothetical protein [Thermodesulfobacteriota bacterium]MEE2975198.1 hypothetical protein [Thermodesulfobacteriota bacterium]|tara:strand:- start:736 stop:951 length:216 start_codon:yes stop_codon:yes gene_type:complete